MPQTRQSEKALRQNIKKAKENRALKAALDTLLKRTKKALAAKSADAEKLVKEAIIKIDKATKRKLLKKNTASRRKSLLMRALNKNKK